MFWRSFQLSSDSSPKMSKSHNLRISIFSMCQFHLNSGENKSFVTNQLRHKPLVIHHKARARKSTFLYFQFLFNDSIPNSCFFSFSNCFRMSYYVFAGCNRLNSLINRITQSDVFSSFALRVGSKSECTTQRCSQAHAHMISASYVLSTFMPCDRRLSIVNAETSTSTSNEVTFRFIVYDRVCTSITKHRATINGLILFVQYFISMCFRSLY